MNIKNETNPPAYPHAEHKQFSQEKAVHYSKADSIKSALSKIWSYIKEFAAVILAAIIYPFASIAVAYNPKKLPPDCKKVTILVHGFLHNSTAWLYLKQRFAKHPELGPIFTINLGHPFHSIETYTERLGKQIETIRKMIPAGEKLKINLVGHSMGGLVSSNYAVNLSEDADVQVDNVVTIASPLKGTKVAKAGTFCPCVKEMTHNGPWVKNLEEKVQGKSGTKWHHIGCGKDLIVSENKAFYEGHNFKVFNNLGHLGPLYSPKVADYIVECLKNDK